MGFDREKAAEVFRSFGFAPNLIDALVKSMSECMTDEPAPQEGRDWIGNPDGTLVYWQREAEDARSKADAAEAKLRRWIAEQQAKP